jgi:hypothetical protein
MKAKLLVVVALVILIGSSISLAQEKKTGEMKSGEGRMMWSAMVGGGFLHDHMSSMIRQMAGMIRMMSQMVKSGKMDKQQMVRMSEIMQEMSTMRKEIPALEEMMDKRPDTAMKDMSKMTKTTSEIMAKMAGMMGQMPKG